MATFGTYDDRNGPVAVARRYDTLLTAVRLALDSDVGPIEWTQSDPARYYTPATGERLIVTPVQWGRLALRPDDLDERLISVLSGVLDRHRFRVTHAERGGFGGLELNADGPDGARFCFMGAPQLRAWVQVPAPEDATT